LTRIKARSSRLLSESIQVNAVAQHLQVELWGISRRPFSTVRENTAKRHLPGDVMAGSRITETCSSPPVPKVRLASIWNVPSIQR
jgi:hypothetical protein